MSPDTAPVRRALPALALLLLAVPAAPALAAPPDDALGATATGRAEAWLTRDGDRRVLVYRASPRSTPRTIAVRLPARSSAVPREDGDTLAIGTDAQGRRVIVVAGARGLVATRVSGRARLRRVGGSTARDTHPSVMRGTYAAARFGPGDRSSVVALRNGRASALWDNRRSGTAQGWYAFDTAIGPDRSVLFTGRRDGAANGSAGAFVVRPGQAVRRVVDNPFGDTRNGDTWIEQRSPRGTRVTVASTSFVESDDDDAAAAAAPVRHVVFALPSGRRVRSTTTTP